MKPFEYGDEEIGSREIGFAVSSTIIGIGALSMPRDIANQTLFSDGWIILLLGGLICAVLGWFVTRVAILFPKQNFVQYTSAHLTKPVAYTISMVLVLTFAALTAYESRMIAIISQTYLFSETPVQLLSFFLLISCYLWNSRVESSFITVKCYVLTYCFNCNSASFFIKYKFNGNKQFVSSFPNGSKSIRCWS